MDVRSLEYGEHATRILRDTPDVRTAVTGATLHFDTNRAHAFAEIDAEVWRRWAEGVKHHTITHLDTLLEEAATKLESNGITVHWAGTADEARAAVRSIVERTGSRRAVKGKSMLSEELGINEMLGTLGVEVFETDLGEYILQLLDEPPSHILGPAIHRSLDDIRRLFHERFDTALDASPETIAAAARRVLRDAFISADVGITGANFVVAETGTIALIENEGNIRLSTSVPRVHIAIAGIEKLLPRWTDLAPFLQLTARAATGQRIGTFVSLIQGPRGFAGTGAAPADSTSGARRAEHDGPDEVHLIFVDNGRTRVLADEVIAPILRCVRCSACLNVCPVYRQTGGHAYGWVYSGPLGAVLNPGLLGLGNTHPLPFASTLCGACADVCPVRIPIPEMLLEWRRRTVEQGLRPASEQRMMSGFATLATRPATFRAAGRLVRALPARIRRALPVLRDWAGPRAAPQPSRRSFLELWKREGRTSAAPADATRNAKPGSPPHPPGRHGDRNEESARNEDRMNEPTRRAFAGGRRGRAAARQTAMPGIAANDVLDRVRSALAERTRTAHPGPLAARDEAAAGLLRPAGEDHDEAVIERFRERATATGANVVAFATLTEAAAWLAVFTREFETAVVGALVSPRLSPLDYGARREPPATARLGVSSAIAAAAETGTVVLDSRDGREAQMLPRSHLVWVQRGAIHPTLAEALDAVRADLPAALGLHSGPSRSADIGRVIVTGVHGPGHVVFAIIP